MASSSTPPNKAWVTLATNDSYSLGALVLAHSLKAVKTVYKLAIMITPGVTPAMKQKIEAVFDEVKVVDVLDSKDEAHLALMNRPELGVTFTKLHCWTFTNYEKCVFLDADTLVLQNCDELFEREEFSAAPDPGWPDCFNTGVFVFKPSQDTFGQLLEFAKTKGSFDGGDQGLLNMFFNDWSYKDISKHLSFTYNVVWSSTYSYLPALKQFGQNMKIIHFITSSKPWLQSFNTETRLVTAVTGGTGLQELLQLWWDLFCRHVHPELSTEMIESRLSSRYSSDHPEVHFNNNEFYNSTPIFCPNKNNFNNYNTLCFEPQKEEHYSFVDPWDEYLVSIKQKPDDIQEEIIFVSKAENCRSGANVVEGCLNNQSKPKIENSIYSNQCEQEMENNYYTHNYDMEEKMKEYRFQESIIKKCNVMENIEKNEHFEEIREFNIPKKNQETIINNKIHPACSEDIPINLNSSLSVNNCRPDSPTHCEVPMDQACDLNGGLAGRFARVSLGEKTTDQMAVEDFLRRQSWEHGNADYLGKDSFSNVWAKISETLGSTPEVKDEPSAVKTSSPVEVLLSEEPKPLKSVLKKTSTTIPPVESELIDSNEPSVKQLEKLDLSKGDPNQNTAPDTPTVTSPTPPTTPASQAQEPSKPESVKEMPKPETIEHVKETPKIEDVVSVKETPKPEAVESVKETPKTETVESVTETPKLAAVEPIKETPKLVAVEPVKETTKPETIESVKETPKTETVKTVKEILKPEVVETIKEISQPDVLELVKETPKTLEPVTETPKSEAVESIKEIPKPDVVKEMAKSVETVIKTPAKTPEPLKQTTKTDESKKESLTSVKLEEVLPESVSFVTKSDKQAKEVSKPAEMPQKPQPSVGGDSVPLESNDPPVAPKRTNKGSSSAPKPAQASEKK